jgi:hypothetical protein
MNPSPILRDVYYGYNINQPDVISENKDENKENIFSIYDKADISSALNDSRTAIVHPESGYYGKIVAKSVAIQNLKEGLREIKTMPPKGPIRELCQCPACGETGPRFHTEICPGPYDNEIFTLDGLKFYTDKITANSDALSSLRNNSQLFYRDLFPERGIQKLKSDRLKIAFFPNVVQFKWATSPIINNEHFGNDFLDGMMITIKVSPHKGVNITHIPYYHPETEPETFLKTIDKLIMKDIIGISDTSWGISKVSYISHINGIYTVTKNDNIIDLNHVSDKIVSNVNLGIFGYTFSSYSSSIVFSFPIESNKIILKATINIKLTSVTMFVSFGSSAESAKHNTSFIGHSKKSLSKPIDIEVLKKIMEKLKILIFNDPKCYIQKKVKRYINEDGKIYNVSLPYNINKSTNLFEYLPKIKTGNAPPQPDKCRNKVNGMSTLKQSYIKRPYPFSFTVGEAPSIGVTLKDEGVTTSAVKFLGNRRVLYEPCCDTITGKDYIKSNKSDNTISKVTIFKNNNIITADEMKTLLNNIDKVSEKPTDITKLKTDVRQVVMSMDSTKSAMFRRAMYGFPNDIFPEDSTLLNNIESGVEMAPKLNTTDEYNGKPTKDIIKIEQPDIHSGVYVPGTQLKNYGGNNTFVRDHRQYYGLFKYLEDPAKKPLLFDVIKKYFDKHNIANSNPRSLNPIPVTYELLQSRINDWYYIVIPKNSTSTIITIPSSNSKNNEYTAFQTENKLYIIDIVTNKENDVFPNRLFKNIPISVKHEIIIPIKFDNVSFKDIANKLSSNLKIIMIEPDNIFIDTKVFQWYPKISEDYIKNAVFHFRVDTSIKNDELIQILIPDGDKNIPINEPDRNLLEMFQFEGKDCMFIQKTTRKNLDNGKVYSFVFNRYIENEKWKLISNQPFILMNDQIVIGNKKTYETVKIPNSLEYTLMSLYVALNAIDLDNIE